MRLAPLAALAVFHLPPSTIHHPSGRPLVAPALVLSAAFAIISTLTDDGTAPVLRQCERCCAELGRNTSRTLTM